ncbi:MAG: trigger factor [Firmicutes bacterium]|nr:trigger factor [Bacillota bacterium]
MTPVLISKENGEAVFKMSFSAEEFDDATAAAYKATKDRYRIDGFRKGKAPRSMIEKWYGEGVFFEDAIDTLLNTNYPKALDELGIEPVDRPNVKFGEEKIEKHKGFEVTVTVTVAPEAELKNYKGLKVQQLVHSVSDEDVQRELEYAQKQNARLVTKEGAAESGDTVILDYAGFCGDNQFEGGTAESQSLKLGSNTFIPGFEDQLVGCSAGDEKEVNVTFPKEYHEESLAGKDAVFKCKIHEV